MMTDLDVFLMHLAQQDFAKICDYLFYYCFSCTDECSYEIAKRALFDLLKNYDFAWKLNLEHIVTALTNLGGRDEALDQRNEH
jgi:hypothetical protein